jgi:hypothetical protein
MQKAQRHGETKDDTKCHLFPVLSGHFVALGITFFDILKISKYRRLNVLEMFTA